MAVYYGYVNGSGTSRKDAQEVAQELSACGQEVDLFYNPTSLWNAGCSWYAGVSSSLSPEQAQELDSLADLLVHRIRQSGAKRAVLVTHSHGVAIADRAVGPLDLAGVVVTLHAFGPCQGVDFPENSDAKAFFYSTQVDFGGIVVPDPVAVASLATSNPPNLEMVGNPQPFYVAKNWIVQVLLTAGCIVRDHCMKSAYLQKAIDVLKMEVQANSADWTSFEHKISKTHNVPRGHPRGIEKRRPSFKALAKRTARKGMVR